MENKPIYRAGLSGDVAEAENVRREAAFVATVIATSAQGFALVYQDEKVCIKFEVAEGDILVEILTDPPQAVLVGDKTGIQEYHPGKWVDHVHKLYALALVKFSTRGRTTAEKLIREKRFGPVDEGGLFDG